MPIKFPFSRRAAPSDAWTKCPSCEAQVFSRQLERSLRLCPSCGRIMLRYRVGHGVDFYLDTCGTCNGIWLDLDEWTALRARNLHDDLHLIFTEPWQAEIHREAAKSHLEALYRKRFGDAWDEAVRVRAWVQAHPERAALLAFLADPDPFEA